MPHTHDSRQRVFHRGPLIVSLESVFWHLQRYPSRRVTRRMGHGRPPLSEPARPRELDGNFRRGEGRVFRVPLTRRAVVLGYWVPAEHDVLPEEEGGKLADVLQAHIPGVTATEISSWARPRRKTSRMPIWLDMLLMACRAFRPGAPDPVVPDHLVRHDEDDEEPEGYVPWDPTVAVIDIEDARVDRGSGRGQSLSSWWGENGIVG